MPPQTSFAEYQQRAPNQTSRAFRGTRRYPFSELPRGAQARMGASAGATSSPQGIGMGLGVPTQRLYNQYEAAGSPQVANPAVMGASLGGVITDLNRDYDEFQRQGGRQGSPMGPIGPLHGVPLMPGGPGMMGAMQLLGQAYGGAVPQAPMQQPDMGLPPMSSADRLQQARQSAMQQFAARQSARAATDTDRGYGGVAPRHDAMMGAGGYMDPREAMMANMYWTQGTGWGATVPQGIQQRAQAALQGDYGTAPPNTENAMLAPQMPGGMRTTGPYADIDMTQPAYGSDMIGGARTEMPVVNSMTPYPGAHLGLTARGVPMEGVPGSYGPVHAPIDTNEFGLPTRLGRAQERARQGGQFVAYRGPYASSYRGEISPEQLESNRQAAIQRRRESQPLPGFPRLPARIGESGRTQSMNRRLAARGLSPMAMPEEGPQPSASLFGSNYRPPQDELGVNRKALAADAAERLSRFEGTPEEAFAQLDEQGLSMGDIRSQAEDLLPGPSDALFSFGTSRSKAEFAERRRKYEALRRFDPTLPPWPEGSFSYGHLENGTGYTEQAMEMWSGKHSDKMFKGFSGYDPSRESPGERRRRETRESYASRARR